MRSDVPVQQMANPNKRKNPNSLFYRSIMSRNTSNTAGAITSRQMRQHTRLERMGKIRNTQHFFIVRHHVNEQFTRYKRT